MKRGTRIVLEKIGVEIEERDRSAVTIFFRREAWINSNKLAEVGERPVLHARL